MNDRAPAAVRKRRLIYPFNPVTLITYLKGILT